MPDESSSSGSERILFPWAAPRALIAKVWRASTRGEDAQLSRGEQHVARCLASHPEWAAGWQFTDDLGDLETDSDGLMPFQSVMTEALAEGLIEDDEDARHAYTTLRSLDFPHEFARGFLALAFFRVVGRGWAEAQTAGATVEALQHLAARLTARFHDTLRQMCTGESVDEILSLLKEATP